MKKIQRKLAIGDKGFTLAEVLISTVILTVGLLMVLALFTKGLSATQYAHQDLIAKQKAREELEAIYAARNNGLAWGKIENSNITGGIFLSGFQQLYQVPQGAVGDAAVMGSTAQSKTIPDVYWVRDSAGNFQSIPLNGTAANLIYQRQVVITDDPNNPNLKNIAVTVRVYTPGIGFRDYTVSGLIAN